MNHNKRTFLKMGSLVMVLVLALTALVSMAGASFTAAPAQAPLNAPQAAIDNPATCDVATGSITCELWATTGTVTLPDGPDADSDPDIVNIWGYADSDTGAAQLPGPTIIATQDDSVTITLHNMLAEDTALIFPGQAMIPDLVGVAPGGTASYTFTASNPGTYLYEAGLLPDAPLQPDAAKQVAMGMFGALVVRPALGPAFAYNDATLDFNDEALLVLSEIDPALNANPGGFDMRDFWPQYRLINGKTYPETADILTTKGSRVLLRYVNAGIQQHTMGVLGMDQELIARDANLRPYPQRELSESIGPGRTADAIVTVPTLPPAGTTHYALYDASLLLHNSGAGFGGMMTFLIITDGTPPATGPTFGQVTLAPNPTDGNFIVEVSATAAISGSVTVAEFYFNSTASAAHLMTVSGDIATGNISISDLSPLVTGDYTIYVRGKNAADVWGAFNFAVLHLDKDGPATTGVTLAPNPSNGGVSGSNTAEDLTGTTLTDATADFSNLDFLVGGTLSNTNDNSSCTVSAKTATTLTCAAPLTGVGDNAWEVGDTYEIGVEVAVSATGNDTASGNSYIAAAEYFIDTILADGFGTDMSVNVTAPIASLDGTITDTTMLGLAEGAHTIYVHSKDEFGWWGGHAEATLAVDKTGPMTSNVVADPNPNNGSQPYSPTVFAVRVDATLSDPTAGINGGVNSTIQRVEGFITTIGADGSGFPLTPRDGLFNEAVEVAYVYIPLSTISQLGVGTHQIYVHAQDASGNWGATDFVDFVIETDIPTVSNVAVTPNTTDGTVLVALTATATDPSSGIDLAEWFTGPDPGMPMDIFFNGTDWDLTATIDALGWLPGTYQINVRAMDAAGNWSPTAFAMLTVTPGGPPVGPEELRFSTIGSGLVPGTTSPYDDADVYLWDNLLATFSREFDARAGGANILPNNADIDGLAFVPGSLEVPDIYYMSFNRNQGTNVPGVGVVQDEDVVTYNTEDNQFELYFAGIDVCDNMDASNGHDIDAFDVVNGVSFFSTAGNAAIAGVPGPYDDADIYSVDPLLGCIRVFRALNAGLDIDADIDGLTVVDADTFYISFNLDAGTFVPVLGIVEDESVVLYDAGVWTMFFDGTTQGLGDTNSQDLDAIDVQ